jgi:hypothetical protein
MSYNNFSCIFVVFSYVDENRQSYSGTGLMPTAAANEKEGSGLGPHHIVPQTAFPRPRQGDGRPLAPPAEQLHVNR